MHVIDPNAVYTEKAVAEVLEVSTWSVMRYRKDGLRFRKPRGKVYILGSDLLDFLRKDDEPKHRTADAKVNNKVNRALREITALRG